ncbi:MAG: hypothetical protein AAF403_05150, partial [Pseudomonadota bacterium]
MDDKDTQKHIDNILKIEHTPLNIDNIKIYFDCLNYYAYYGYPQSFMVIKPIILKKFAEALDFCGLWQGLALAETVNLCIYSLFSKQHHLVHVEIACYIAMPFYLWAKKQNTYLEGIFVEPGDTHVFIVRTTGLNQMYGLPKLLYSYCKILLE